MHRTSIERIATRYWPVSRRDQKGGPGAMKKRPAKPIEDKKHRAPREQEPFSAIRLASKLTAAIDKGGEANGVTSRSEAIRRLLELGLAVAQPLHRRNLEATSKAL